MQRIPAGRCDDGLVAAARATVRCGDALHPVDNRVNHRASDGCRSRPIQLGCTHQPQDHAQDAGGRHEGRSKPGQMMRASEKRCGATSCGIDPHRTRIEPHSGARNARRHGRPCRGSRAHVRPRADPSAPLSEMAADLAHAGALAAPLMPAKRLPRSSTRIDANGCSAK